MDKKKIVKNCMEIVFGLGAFILISPLLVYVDIMKTSDVVYSDCMCAVVMAINLIIAMFCSEKEQEK